VATITMPEATDSIEAVVGSDEILYEVVDGQLVELPPMGAYPTKLASVLGIHLGSFVFSHPNGQVVLETIFRFDRKNQKRPDVAFISHERWAEGRRTPDGDPWDVIPDLAIEVVSKTDVAWEVLGKVHFYLKAGVRSVWLVYPNVEVVHIFDSPTQIRVLTRDDVLDGGDLIPDFRLPLSSVFENRETGEDEADPAD
jgi:Uma2 family endonuclease